MTLETGDIEIFLDVDEELLPNSCPCGPRRLRISGDGYAPSLAAERGALPVQPPFGNQAVAILAIERRIVSTDDHPQLLDVEVGIARHHRIECPFNQLNSAL